MSEERLATATRDAQRRLGTLVDQLKALAAEDLSRQEFFSRFLSQITLPLNSAAAAVWLQSDLDHLELAAEQNLFTIEGVAEPEAAARHARLLERALATDKGILAAPQYSLGGEGGAGNPTGYLLVLAPLQNHRRTIGAVELFQWPDVSPSAQRGLLGFLLRACEPVEEFLKNHSLREYDANQASWSQIERFSRSAHGSLRSLKCAYTIANEGRRLLECDRLSVTVCRGRKCHLVAVSGQDVFDRRSNAVPQLEQLATRVVRAGEPLWFPGETGVAAAMPPQLETALDGFLDASHARMVVVLPLERPAPAEENTPAARPAPIGALIAEQFRDPQPLAGFERRVELVRHIAAVALANSREYEGLVLAPLSRGIARLAVLGKRPWLRIALLCLAALALVLLLVPAKFDLEGRGTLEPVNRHDVFAAVSGRVEHVRVDHGALVQPEQLLLELSNTDEDIRRTDFRAQIAVAEARLREVNVALLGTTLGEEERSRRHGERQELLNSLEHLHKQRDLQETKMKELEVRSPVAGQVVTWDIQGLLASRPVDRGQMLLSIADVEGEWQLEVRMPEDRMGHITDAQQALGNPLPVTFLLATEPGKTFTGTLAAVHARAEVHRDEGNTVLVKVAINKADLKPSQLRRGATVIAKVDCGRRPLGYVWFHDLIEFVDSRILFRL